MLFGVGMNAVTRRATGSIRLAGITLPTNGIRIGFPLASSVVFNGSKIRIGCPFGWVNRLKSPVRISGCAKLFRSGFGVPSR